MVLTEFFSIFWTGQDIGNLFTLHISFKKDVFVLGPWPVSPSDTVYEVVSPLLVPIEDKDRGLVITWKRKVRYTVSLDLRDRTWTPENETIGVGNPSRRLSLSQETLSGGVVKKVFLCPDVLRVGYTTLR